MGIAVAVIYTLVFIPIFALSILLSAWLGYKKSDGLSIYIRAACMVCGAVIVTFLTYEFIDLIPRGDNEWRQFSSKVATSLLFPVASGLLLVILGFIINRITRKSCFQNIFSQTAIGALQAVWIIPILTISYLIMNDYNRNMIDRSEYKDFVKKLAEKNGCHHINEFNIVETKSTYRLYEIFCDDKTLIFECQFTKQIPCYLK